MPESSPTPRIAVAVVSWNTRELLDRCLRSFEPEHERGMVDLWVVDNGSGDGSPEMARERFLWVNLVASQENLGFGKAVNLVAGRTSTPRVAPATGTPSARRVPWAVGAFMIVRREAWDRRGVSTTKRRPPPRRPGGREVAPVWQCSTYGFMARRLGMPRTWAIAVINLDRPGAALGGADPEGTPGAGGARRAPCGSGAAGCSCTPRAVRSRADVESCAEEPVAARGTARRS